MSLPFHAVIFPPAAPEAGGSVDPLTPEAIPPLRYNCLLPLTVNTSVALCTYIAPLFMYIVSVFGMEGKIQICLFHLFHQ